MCILHARMNVSMQAALCMRACTERGGAVIRKYLYKTCAISRERRQAKERERETERESERERAREGETERERERKKERKKGRKNERKSPLHSVARSARTFTRQLLNCPRSQNLHANRKAKEQHFGTKCCRPPLVPPAQSGIKFGLGVWILSPRFRVVSRV